MRKLVCAVLCGIALSACNKEPGAMAPPGGGATTSRAVPSDLRNAKVSEVIQPAPQFIDHALLGSELGKDGVVAKDSDKITAGQPVYLTMFLRESPPGLQTSAVWTTEDKKPLRTERKEMNGAKAATFGFNDPKMKPGHYRVVGYWGGNIAAEREFEIVAPPAKAKRKKG